MKSILTLICCITTLILTTTCGAQSETVGSNVVASGSLFPSKLNWHGDIDDARGAVVQGTVTDLTNRASNEAIRGTTISYRSDTAHVEVRADPAQQSYLTSDGQQCRTVTVTILVEHNVVSSFGRQVCAKVEDLLPPVKKEK